MVLIYDHIKDNYNEYLLNFFIEDLKNNYLNSEEFNCMLSKVKKKEELEFQDCTDTNFLDIKIRLKDSFVKNGELYLDDLIESDKVAIGCINLQNLLNLNESSNSLNDFGYLFTDVIILSENLKTGLLEKTKFTIEEYLNGFTTVKGKKVRVMKILNKLMEKANHNLEDTLIALKSDGTYISLVSCKLVIL